MDKDTNKTEYIESDITKASVEEETKKDVKVSNRSKAIKIIAVGILTFALLIGAAVAWFATGTEAGGKGMSMASDGMPFEISVDSPYTTTPDYSDIINSEFGYHTDEHETGGNIDSIKWVMYDDTFDALNPMRGLRPGSKGVFRFNIIPKIAGTYTLAFNPVITGYYAEFDTDPTTRVIDPESIKTENGTYVLQTLDDRTAAKQTEYDDLIAAGRTAEAQIALKEKQACIKAGQYLKGHLLLFEGCDEDGCYSALRTINQEYTKTYTFTQNDVDNETPIPVTIYWIWPNTFGQFLLDDGNVNLHDKAMFDSSQSAIEGVTPRNELISYICSNPGYYFDSNNTSITGDGLNAYINGVINNTSPDNLIALSNGYNNADQIIGENIQILLAEMVISFNEE